jgi:hypothetical protein
MAQRMARPIPVADDTPAKPGDRLPPDVEAELGALERLSDDVLWAVARSRMNTAKQRRWHRLLERGQQGALTDQEQEELSRLMADGDRLTLCKAQAYLLLKERGYRIPELDKPRG